MITCIITKYVKAKIVDLIFKAILSNKKKSLSRYAKVKSKLS